MNSTDQHSPRYSNYEEDVSENLSYTLKSSTRRTPNVQSFSTPVQRFQEASLIYQDIVTDEQTLEFLYKHFSGVHPEALDIESFLDVLLQEFFIRNPSLPNTIEDIEFFRKELRDLLRNSLTTNDDEVVSLNALEVNTNKKGLYNFVFDLAMEAEGESKAKKNTQINEAIVNELSIVTQMLDNKKEELRIYEKKLREYEASLIERENQMRQSIQSEYERLVTSFDEGYREKFNGIQKKFSTHEKSTKQKIKQYESQIKEMKTFTASLSGNEEKLKYKLSSLERTNDFLKHKTQDLEKKLAQEQEAKLSTSQKNQKLLSKVSLLEKSMKDLQTLHTAGSLAASQNFPKHFGLEALHEKHDERPLEVIDLNASQTKGWEEREMTEPRGASLSPDFDDKEEENKNSKGAKKKPVAKFATTSSLMKKNTKKETPAVVETSPVKKKKPTVGTTSASGPSGEMKVLLNVVHSLIVCLKSTLPVFILAYDSKEGSPRKEQGPRVSTREENLGEKVTVDLGEIFYPSFESLITNLTELLPIIGKQYDTKYVSSIVEMYYKLINFFFKLKVQHKFDHTDTPHRLFSDHDIANSTNRIKTGQDHINEVMVISQSPKENAELNFVPQTEYWKKIIKTAKPLQKSKYGVDLQSSVMNSLAAKNSKPSQNKSEGNFISLFGEEIVQKEVASILKKYLDSTEVLLCGSEKEAGGTSNVIVQANMSLETQKYLQITRIYSSLSTILLAKTKKEQLLGLQSLLVDLNIDNVKIAEFLRVFLIENDGLNVVFWILKNNIDDFEMLQVATDILLSLNYNGAHYKYFIETISQQENIEIIFAVLTSHGQNNEFCEKMSVIVQRVTYHNSLQGKIPPKQIKFLKEKLNELEVSNKNQFFIANIKSILVNLNAI